MRSAARLLLVVDNGSSYTGDLLALLEGLDVSYKKVIPSEIDLDVLFGQYTDGKNKKHDRDGIILSGRKRNDRIMNQVNSKIVKHAIDAKIKLLGICYGAEIMALSLGGTIVKSAAPQRNVHTVVNVTKDTPLATAGSKLDVFESHSYEISKLPSAFESVGGSAECQHEIVRYGSIHVYGTQFHPEMSRDGRRIIERFCQL